MKFHCCFCSWSSEIDDTLAFTCPSCGIEFGVLDDDSRKKANQIITEFIEKYQNGRTDFPTSEDIGFACCKLEALSGKAPTPISNKLSSALWTKKGVTQYSKVLPLIIEFQKQINNLIDNSQAKQGRVPLREDELPF
jgi:predicted RNA-binding Zn-ribbon protein involved in translation (DUF1610 family)